MRRAWIVFCLLLLLLSAGESAPLRRPKRAAAPTATPGMMEALHNVRDDRIRADVKYLASDELEGRGTGARGGDMAANYIAKEFKAAGLEPAGDNGGYFQKVSMVGITTMPGTTVAVKTPAREMKLKLLDDVVVFSSAQNEISDVSAGVVFVGYGIDAPEFGWNDYAGIDVRGKVLLMLVNEPPSTDPNFFGGKALTYYGRWTYKFEEAARKGAAGVLLIHREDMASYGWQVVRSSWSGERSALAADADPKLAMASWVQFPIAKQMVADAGQDLDSLIASAQHKGFHAVPLPLQVTSHVVSAIRHFESNNVIGKLTGSDAELKQQAIFITAHYDHLGIRPDQPGDNIYNGALDNASGAAMLMEMGRAMAAAPQRPKRTVYFVATTAEEQGLWGSEYLTRHLPLPAADIALNLNFDSIKPLGIPREVVASGYEKTTFAPVFDKTAEDFKLKILPDPEPGSGGYYRSDHFSFARAGVPAFSIENGEHFSGHPEAWVKSRSEEMDRSYHQPNDEYKESDDYRSNAVFARFGIALAYRAGNLPGLVQWKPGAEFEKVRKGAAQ